MLRIENKEGLREQLAYIAIFLFPLAGNTIRSWSSTIFTLIVLLALVTRPWRGVVLQNWERWLLIIMVVLFAIMMFSNIANGWEHRQTRELGVQLRYLFFVPVYFLFRRHEDSLLWLVRGTIFAAVILLLQAVYEIWISYGWRVAGVYGSPGLYATQALLFSGMLFFALVARQQNNWSRGIIVFAMLSALLGLLFSGSRTTYITLVTVLAVAALIFLTWRKTILIYLVGVSVLVFSFLFVGVFHDRVISGIDELREYMSLSDPVHEPIHGSVGQRFEMWRAAWMIFQDNPIIGVGRGNFSVVAEKYIEEGLAHSTSAGHPHPHNGYLEFMVSNGGVGLVLLLALLILPYRACVVAPSACADIAHLGKLFVLIFTVNSFNEAATFIYGNFLSVYLIYFGAIFAALGRCQAAGNNAPRPVSGLVIT